MSLAALPLLGSGAQAAIRPALRPYALPTNVRPTTVAQALIFDSNVPAGTLQTQETNENVGYVWGASEPEVPGGSAWHDLYGAWAQGWCPGYTLYDPCPPNSGPPSYPWLEKYHPDWLLWQTNRKGTPTRYAISFANPGPIVDFTNSALQQFWINRFLGPFLRSGYNGVSWDNPTAYNPYAAVGHYDTKGRFVKLYSGASQDPTWAKKQAQALSQFLQRAQRIRPSAQFSLNASADCLYASKYLWSFPLKYVHTVADEEGYTYWGNKKPWVTSSPGPYCSNRWLQKTQTFIALQKAGKWLVLIDQVPIHNLTPYMTDTDATARSYMQWALANYFLVKYTHTYFWFGKPQVYGNPIIDQHELLANLGTPVGDMKSTSHVYERTYTKGLAIVNPSPGRTYTVALPRGKYKSLYGQQMNSATMGPHTGLVLVTAK